MGENGDFAGTSGTSGAPAGTHGFVARDEARALLAIMGLGLVSNLVNIATILADRASDGLPTTPWQVWLAELSSWVGLVLMLPLVRRAARGLRPPLLPWAAAPLAHLPVAMFFSAGHVAIMLAIRQLGYAAMKDHYEFFGDNPGGVLLYEFRKDILSYTAAVLVLLLVRANAESRQDRGSAQPAETLLEFRDGPRTIWLRPDEILCVEAAANYVEVTTASGTLLHRDTLTGLEARLGHEFVRVHRSRLVRRGAIRELHATGSGDFELVLADGRTVAGSRRYRDRLSP